MEYYYYDTSAIIELYKNKALKSLSKYKEFLHIADLQVKYEVLRPDDLIQMVYECMTIDIVTIEEFESIIPIMAKHKPLSKYDALALVICIEKNYCLVTNDIDLKKACSIYNVSTVSSQYIEDNYIKGGN